MPTIRADSLKQFAFELFLANEVPQDEAKRVAQSLVLANLCGHDSHGVIRVIQYQKALTDGQLQSGVSLNIEQETPAVVVADGQWGLGQVQAHRLLDLMIPRAQSLGISSGTIKHCGHIGRLGEYAEVATANQLAFFATVNNHGFARGVAPPGGKEARIGTNPICLAVPTESEPVILDIGTSVVAEGKVRVAFNKGVEVPDGWLLDPEGNPTTDPGVLYREPRGTIQPLGGSGSHKGFGLGLLLDMFIGGFSGGPCSNPVHPYRSGNAVMFMLFDPKLFHGTDHFLSEVQGLVASIRECPLREDAKDIMLPGEPERRERERREQDGIPLDDGTWGQLTELAKSLNVSIPST